MPVAARYPTTNQGIILLTTPENAGADDGANVQFSQSGIATGQGNWGGFHFDSAIPPNAQITKVLVKVEQGNNVETFQGFALVRGSGPIFTITHPATYPFVDSIDITSDHVWTRSDFLDGVFEVALSMTNETGGAPEQANIDYIRVEVSYELYEVGHF